MNEGQEPLGYGIASPSDVREWEQKEARENKQRVAELQEKCKMLEALTKRQGEVIENLNQKVRDTEAFTEINTLRWVIKNLPR